MPNETKSNSSVGRPTPPATGQSIHTAAIRQSLEQRDGPTYWRSLDELAGTDEFRESLHREFPALADRWDDGVSRRDILKVMGASLALVGLNGCFRRNPQGTIVPYTREPQQTIAGRPVYFATTMPFDGYGKGILALSREGRPVKLEGNPDHPASLGAADIFMQASLLDLYDPDRSRNVLCAGETVEWGEFYGTLIARLRAGAGNGAGIRLLTETVTSPTLTAQIQAFLKLYPGAVWHRYDPIRTPDGGQSTSIFAQPVNQQYDLTNVAVVASFGGDLFFRDPGSVRYARQFMDGRRVRDSNKKMNRLYVAESAVSITGSMADHRLVVKPSQMAAMAIALAKKLGAAVPDQAAPIALTPAENQWIDALAQELTHRADGMAALVVAGEYAPPAVHAAVYLINEQIGAVGKSVRYTDPIESPGASSLRQLVDDMQNGRVDSLVMIGTNPAYNAPCDIPFANALKAMSAKMDSGQYVHFTAHLATHYDETSFLCQWHAPRAHWLESWGDVRAFDGTASLIQPLIAPMFGALSDWEMLEAMLGRPTRGGLEILRDFWMNQRGSADFESWWMATLQKGVIADTSLPHRAPPLRADVFNAPTTAPDESIELLFEPDPTIWNGDYANNGWLQELPKPFSKLTWDNAVLINIKMAEKLGGAKGVLLDGQLVQIDYDGRQLNAPIVLMPGQADDLIVLHLGYGRSHGGQVLLEDDQPRGYNAYALRTSKAPWQSSGVKIKVLDDAQFLAITRNHHAMSSEKGVPGIEPWLKSQVVARPGDLEMDLATSNRDLIRTATLEQFKNDPHVIESLDPSAKKPLLSLYPGWDYNHGLQWGMSIDMTSCIGCNACIIACQAENNIPVVGKKEVGRQREMHWIRIDDYFDGSLDSPVIFHQPVPCMHCENAPCEYVCPVGATTHSDEGLNEMTYNRCVGTRYCSNNCPYKVRRFNFLLYSDFNSPTLKLMHNPDVTVRSRGVMEKCSYCLQRIDGTRMEMEKQVLDLERQARLVPAGPEQDRLMQAAQARGRDIVRTLQTACQQTCPTEAIVFGDIRDPGAQVTQLKKESANYGLLTDLTTKPRTTYLARITNPNPALAANGGRA